MANRKQRRRREKLKRHEYEYVLETEEGEEIALESPRTAETKQNGKAARPTGGPVDRRGRPLQKPTFRRVLKRSAIFAPLIAVFIAITGGGLSVAGMIFQVLLLLAFFIPFSYMVDVFVYRMLMRRHERERAARRASR
jgi:hypothetical protein